MFKLVCALGIMLDWRTSGCWCALDFVHGHAKLIIFAQIIHILLKLSRTFTYVCLTHSHLNVSGYVGHVHSTTQLCVGRETPIWMWARVQVSE